MAQNWDAWKDHDRYEEQAIYRFEAEKEQIRTEPMVSEGKKDTFLEGYKNIYVRDVFVAGCPKEYEVNLRLGIHFRPMVAIKTPEGVITFIANLEKEPDADESG